MSGVGLGLAAGLAAGFAPGLGDGDGDGIGIWWPSCWPRPVPANARIRKTTAMSLAEFILVATYGCINVMGAIL
jgi:hypothetical protein